ncbi:hypothetical protein [Sabulibacter ruber]|uniref:hypothetical protein n=1 Tax=Sabulibacter ruber TaxID=2811901 RepID=UPI001A96E7C7|nr:hypothetical protein [Sabulibacter ruber]
MLPVKEKRVLIALLILITMVVLGAMALLALTERPYHGSMFIMICMVAFLLMVFAVLCILEQGKDT